MSAWSERLPAYTVFAGVISAAGLPIYIYAPTYYAETYGIRLTTLGAVLFGLRLFDVVQDPALGWISERLGRGKPVWVSLGALAMALSMLALFAAAPPINPIVWFGLSITGLFTAFSFLSINFYAQGIRKAGPEASGHTRLAAWRESGSLLGVCIAAVTPTLLMGAVAAPFSVFAWGFAVASLLAAAVMWPEWKGRTTLETPVRAGVILSDTVARRLMILALVNATPLAVSSTLFLFYVQSRLDAPGAEGPLLVLFFLAAAISSPAWSALARRFGAKRVLLAAMVLAVVSFGFTLGLGKGDLVPFAVICVASGATIGADLTLLPAMFARRMAVISPNGGQGFGLWSLMNKLTLAFAAAALLPVLEGSGYVPGDASPPAQALWMLTILYALVPSVLKLVAIGLLVATPLPD